jgi:hypothetical protein
VGECRFDPVGSGEGPVAGSCEYDDEPSGSGATELVKGSSHRDIEEHNRYAQCYLIIE